MVLDEVADKPQILRTQLAALQREGHGHDGARRQNRSPAENETILRAPIPTGSWDTFDPVNEQLEFFRAESAAGALAGHPGKRPPFQSFGVEHQARPIPKEDLQPVATLIGEDKEMSADGILLEDFLHQDMQPVKTLAAVDGANGDKHPRGGRQ